MSGQMLMWFFLVLTQATLFSCMHSSRQLVEKRAVTPCSGIDPSSTSCDASKSCQFDYDCSFVEKCCPSQSSGTGCCSDESQIPTSATTPTTTMTTTTPVAGKDCTIDSAFSASMTCDQSSPCVHDYDCPLSSTSWCCRVAAGTCCFEPTTPPTTTLTTTTEVTVSGETTTVLGETTTSSGETTTVSGETTTASGETTTTSGEITTVTGETTTTSGKITTVTGETTTTSREITTVTGETTTASGEITTVTGETTTASGEITTAPTTRSPGRNCSLEGNFPVGSTCGQKQPCAQDFDCDSFTAWCCQMTDGACCLELGPSTTMTPTTTKKATSERMYTTEVFVSTTSTSAESRNTNKESSLTSEEVKYSTKESTPENMITTPEFPLCHFTSQPCEKHCECHEYMISVCRQSKNGRKCCTGPKLLKLRYRKPGCHHRKKNTSGIKLNALNQLTNLRGNNNIFINM